MAKYNDLLVGDMHAQVSNLSDTEKLLDLISEEADRREVNRVIFLGDLFHTHSVMRQEVAHLYREKFKHITRWRPNRSIMTIYIVAGNHDGVSPTNADKNACQIAFGDMPAVNVISKIFMGAGYTMVAFTHDNSKFIAYTKFSDNAHDEILLCHQSFDGACYESGAPIPNGVRSSDVIQPLIISGHIHKAQIVNKVNYIGTPRMVTAGEANDSKYIYHITGESAADVKLDKICTDSIVKRYFKISYTEGDGKIVKLDLGSINAKDGDEIRVTVNGSEEYNANFAKENEDLIGKIRIIPNIIKKLDGKVSIEETDGDIRQAMQKYIMEVADIDERLRDKVWQKISAMI